MQETCVQDASQVEDQLDEEKLIRQLIEKKKREREEKKNQLAPGQSGPSQGGDTPYGETMQNLESSMNPGTYNQQSASNAMQGDNSESVSNTQLNEYSRSGNGIQGKNSGVNNEASNITTQTSQWAKQKEFLKLSNTCQNKEKINHAIEKLIEACP